MNKDEIIKSVDERVKDELKGYIEPDMLGYIYVFEKIKKEILEKEYGIAFQTNREKNNNYLID